MRARVDQNRAVIDDRIPIFANAVFWWNVIVGHACFWKNCAHPDVSLITIRGTVLFDDVMPKARTLIYAENAVYATHNTTNSAPDNSTYRPSSPSRAPRSTPSGTP
jgi:hypothetical protein